jgi:hypothetical protein
MENVNRKTMQVIIESLTSALFFLFIAVQVGLLGIIVVARLLKAAGVIKQSEDQGGIGGFLQGFC